MKKNLLYLFIAISLTFGNSIYAQSNSSYQEGKIWIKLKDDYLFTKAQKRSEKSQNVEMSELPFLQEISAKYGLERVYRPFFASDSPVLQNTFMLEFSMSNKTDALIKELLQMGVLEYAERVPLDEVAAMPNDPNYNITYQWGLMKINAAQAWDISTGSPNAVVAVVDNAFDINHPELSIMVYNNVGESPTNIIDDDWNGYIDDRKGFDVADMDNNLIGPSNTWNHGTHTFGVIAARTNNNGGIASIGYGIRVIPVKATKNTSSPNAITHGYEGIVYAVIAGARVINCPWGSQLSSITAQNVINWANSKNVLVIAAAGNANTSNNFYPAAFNGVMGVGSTTASDKKSSFSNFGPNIDVMAPGSDIYSCVPSNQYTFMSGTSQSSALVTGMAGLMLSLNPNMPASELENCIKGSCDNIDYMNTGYIGQIGSGRINAYSSMLCLQTLANTAPVANFTASDTVIFAGKSIKFFDQSTNIPSSWQWTISGGTPASSTSQNPTITYSTPGSYTVTLQATNTGGQGTKTKNFYITVLPTTGCEKITNTQPGDQMLTYTIGAGGYLGGHNKLSPQITKWSDFYNNYAPYTYVTGAEIHFSKLFVNNPNSFVTVTMWDATGPSNAPGNVLATKNVTLQEIKAYVGTNYKPMTVLFDSAITIPGAFHVGIQITHTAGDTVAIAYTQNLNGIPQRPNTAWSYGFYSAQWYQLTTIFGGAPEFNMHIYPLVTDTFVKAKASPTVTSVCIGDTLQLSSAGSTNATSFTWKFHGAFPASSNNPNPKVVFTVPGKHYQYLSAHNLCGTPAGATIVVNVKGVLDLNLISAAQEICVGGSTTIEATSTNASTYTWNNGLPATPGPHTISPSSTTVYTVTADSGGCKQSADITIKVKDVPIASAMYFPNMGKICKGEQAWFDPTNSIDANTYLWTFTNGNPANSTAKFPTITYATAGSHAYTLLATNSCGNHTFNGTVVISNCNPTGTEEFESKQSVTAFFTDDYNLKLSLKNYVGNTNVRLYNALGQVVFSSNYNIGNNSENIFIPVNRTNGIYFLNITNGDDTRTLKVGK